MNNAYAAYQNTGIKTASQGKLIVLLYEGAVKNLTAAGNCFGADGKIEAKDIGKFGSYIMKAQDIISELQVSLDMEKGGQIAEVGSDRLRQHSAHRRADPVFAFLAGIRRQKGLLLGRFSRGLRLLQRGI